MKRPVSKEHNRENMLDACNSLSTKEYCIFYGTALGLYRDGDVIEGDDDVDILLEDKDFEEADQLLKDNGFKSSLEYNGQRGFPKIFSQYYKIRNGIPTLLDLYFYENIHEKYISEKWNWYGTPSNTRTHLLIPKPIVFQIREEKYFGQTIKVPNNMENMCKYVYGPRFREPLRKKIDYIQKIVNNQFVIEYLDKK